MTEPQLHWSDMLRGASDILGFIKPELPTLVPEPPTGDGWIHEIKYDGYRPGPCPGLHPERE